MTDIESLDIAPATEPTPREVAAQMAGIVASGELKPRVADRTRETGAQVLKTNEGITLEAAVRAFADLEEEYRDANGET
jgi:hypothetical protein